jgi:hypothetical protein
MAPSKTPEPIIRKLSELLIKLADDPEVKETMRNTGADTAKTTIEQFRARSGQEIAHWRPLIRRSRSRNSCCRPSRVSHIGNRGMLEYDLDANSCLRVQWVRSSLGAFQSGTCPAFPFRNARFERSQEHTVR